MAGPEVELLDEDGCRRLLSYVIKSAVSDGLRGDPSSIRWVMSGKVIEIYCSVLNIDVRQIRSIFWREFRAGRKAAGE